MTAPRKRLSRDERRAQLLDTAEGLFASQGYEATTMDDVAKAAGVTRAVVYAHFASREAILLDGIRRAHEELDRRLAELAADTDPGVPVADVVERGGDLFFAMLESAPSRWALLFAPILANAPDAVASLPEMRRTTVLRIMDIGVRMRTDVDARQVEAVAYMVSGLGEQLGRWWLTQPDVPREQVVAYYRDFIVGGLGATIRDA
ncbi:TetR/AcrR family transcriptional regulator [Herbiconiux sp. YIM B11900]|uniref:TetR/AcrR family transcriptional regulator n=1 Tax=Herbiconiux sp. YIM B11900 TaxID=3404131 RepID=UPI003F841E51